MRCVSRRRALLMSWALALLVAVPMLAAAQAQPRPAGCTGMAGEKPVYLTFDTGHMEVAPLVADVLKRHGVKASFFLANERTRTGGASLDDEWASWWRERAAEGHVFGSHTWDHDVWQADLPAQVGGTTRFNVRPTQGPVAGRTREFGRDELCRELQRPAARFAAITGQTMSPLWRAPGGKTSAALLAAAESCGWAHVPWTPAGFLGDELPSDRYPNQALLAQALKQVRAGDILLAHLGIWSRKDPWAPAVLEPLITGLRERGLCFATLAAHPRYGKQLGMPPSAPR
jgi:peptidoglycan-N-acetylmuramic acid deacetylase